MLSRDLHEISRTYNASAVMVRTYAEGGNRLVDAHLIAGMDHRGRIEFLDHRRARHNTSPLQPVAIDDRAGGKARRFAKPYGPSSFHGRGPGFHHVYGFLFGRLRAHEPAIQLHDIERRGDASTL